MSKVDFISLCAICAVVTLVGLWTLGLYWTGKSTKGRGRDRRTE